MTLILEKQSKRCVIIDPGGDAESILALVNKLEATVTRFAPVIYLSLQSGSELFERFKILCPSNLHL
jgi:adenine/guanine phosphoribosyltransferase-like PRPP-binding protein